MTNQRAAPAAGVAITGGGGYEGGFIAASALAWSATYPVGTVLTLQASPSGVTLQGGQATEDPDVVKVTLIENAQVRVTWPLGFTP